MSTQDNNTTSEVGSDLPNVSESAENNENSENLNISNDYEKWRAIFELQNKNFVELIKTVKSDKSKNEDNKMLMLPKFDADLAGSDVVSWCSTVDLILAENPLQGSALIIALSRSLLGSASQWLSSVCFPGIKWCDFKELIVQRFGGIELPAAKISNILNSRPKANECLSVYGSRIVTSLVEGWKNLNKEEIAVSLALAHVAHIDNRLKRSLFTTKISTRNELQQELKAFAYMKGGEERQESNLVYPEPKRIKLSTNLKCHFCGKSGHKIADCRIRMRSEKISMPNSFTALKKDGGTIVCYKCGQPGHIASRCTSRNNAVEGGKQKTSVEKTVNMCVIEPKGILQQSGESFQFYFDSGAECSLLRESISMKFAGIRINNVVILKGIGNGTIHSTLQIESNVKIDDYVLEILFHVVPDNCVKYDIVVGGEILGMGFVVQVALNDFKIFKNKIVEICEITDQFDVNLIDTELTGNDKLKLIDIMIVATTKIEALARLKIVLDILSKAGFSFNVKKCSFLKTCVQYLGYEVAAGEIRPNPRKIKALTELPPPQSVSQLRQFIGLSSYFRQFVHKFSQRMKPLYLLTTAKKIRVETRA